MPQVFVSNNYSISNPNYTYAQTLFDIADSLGFESVYGRMSAEEFADSWEKQTLEIVNAQ